MAERDEGVRDAVPAFLAKLDINLLKSLVVVCESRNDVSAARKLNISQPALSLQMKRLEERSAGLIFEAGRKGKRRRLTSYGKRVLQCAHRAVAAYNDVIICLAETDLAGEIRLGIPEWITNAGLQAILLNFQKQYSNIRFNIVVASSDCLRHLIVSGELDLSVSIVEGTIKPIATAWHEPLHWVCDSKLICLNNTILPVSLFHDPCPFRRHAAYHFKKTDQQWCEKYRHDSVAAVKAIVEAGLAISILPGSVITKDVHILGSHQGFERLPDIELGVFRSETSYRRPEVDELARRLCAFKEYAIS
jgi:DNA-binding transcriptional LysR family regulator